MKHPKQYYKSINAGPYRWSGFYDQLHYFTEGDNRSGFTAIACTDDDIECGNLPLMIKLGRTRIK